MGFSGDLGLKKSQKILKTLPHIRKFTEELWKTFKNADK